MNDLAGPRVPYDMMYAGEQAVVSYQLTRWNDPVYQALAQRSFPGVAAGIDTPFSRGALMLTEGLAFQLWVTFPFAALPAFATLPAGYHFLAAWLQGPDRHTPGVVPYSIALTFHCLAVFNVGTGNFNLYDNNLAGLPPIN